MVVACDTATKLTRQWSPVHRRRSLPLLLLLPTAALHLPLGEVERSLFTALPVSLVVVATDSLAIYPHPLLLGWVDAVGLSAAAAAANAVSKQLRPRRAGRTRKRRPHHRCSAIEPLPQALHHQGRRFAPHSTPPLAVEACGDASSPCDAVLRSAALHPLAAGGTP